MIRKIGGASYISEPHYEYFDPRIDIGSYSSIADKVTFCGKVNHAWIGNKKMISTYPFNHIFKLDVIYQSVGRGDIFIGSDVWIGAEAFILDGVTIGDGAIVGAKAVVAKNVPPYAVVVGNPATVKYYRFNSEQIEKLLKIKWWNWDLSIIEERVKNKDFDDIDIFLEKYYDQSK